MKKLDDSNRLKLGGVLQAQDLDMRLKDLDQYNVFPKFDWLSLVWNDVSFAQIAKIFGLWEIYDQFGFVTRSILYIAVLICSIILSFLLMVFVSSLLANLIKFVLMVLLISTIKNLSGSKPISPVPVLIISVTRASTLIV